MGLAPATDERLHANSLYFETLADLGHARGAGVAGGDRRARRVGASGGGEAPATRILALGVAAALGTYLLHGALDYFLEFTPTYALFWLLAGMIVALERSRGDLRVTRDESLEALLLVQYVALVRRDPCCWRGSGTSRIAHALPSLKPPVAPGEYAHLLVVFLPIWVFAAERLGIHRVRVLTGPRIELARRLILTQAWGLAAVALILVAAQTAAQPIAHRHLLRRLDRAAAGGQLVPAPLRRAPPGRVAGAGDRRGGRRRR